MSTDRGRREGKGREGRKNGRRIETEGREEFSVIERLGKEGR